MALSGRLALITGGGSGIGRATARLFAREGAKVAVVDVNQSGAQDTVGNIEHGRAYAVDITSSAAVAELLASVRKDFAQTPCIAVNSAGITRDGMMLKMKETAFDDVVNVNLKGTFLVCQEVGRHMLKDKVRDASIVNIASIVGKMGNIGQTNYAATKAGVIGLSKSIAKELGPKGIRCNAILPGFIETPMVETVPDNIINMMQMLTPLQRIGKPEEIAETCLFLASNKSSFITGAAVEVTGGFSM